MKIYLLYKNNILLKSTNAPKNSLDGKKSQIFYSYTNREKPYDIDYINN